MTVSVFYNGVIVHQLKAKIEHRTFSNPILPPVYLLYAKRWYFLSTKMTCSSVCMQINRCNNSKLCVLIIFTFNNDVKFTALNVSQS